MKKIVLLALVMTVILSLTACEDDEVKYIESSSKDIPQWVVNQASFERDNSLYFVGLMDKVQSLNFTRDAVKTATIKVSEQISLDSIGYYQKLRSANNFTDNEMMDIEDAIKTQSKASLSGIEEAGTFWVKVKEKSTGKEYFRIYTLLKISKDSFNESKKITIEKALQITKQKAEQSNKKEMIEKLEKIEKKLNETESK